MHELSIDIETFSDQDIKQSGSYKYVQSPNFEILLFAYSYDRGPVHVLDFTAGEQNSLEFYQVRQMMQDPGVIKRAYNATFEWYCLNKFYNAPLEQWRCTQFHGLFCGYPMGLANVGAALGIPQDMRKMGMGKSLIRTFCVPQKPTKANGFRTRTLPHHEPEKWQLFKKYCGGDVTAEMEIERRLTAFQVPDEEQALWCLDHRINATGVMVDRQMVEAAIDLSNASTAALLTEAISLSGVSNPKSRDQLKNWLTEELDEELPDLKKDTVKALLKRVDDDTVRRVLEIRQELAKTSVTKYAAMLASVCDDDRIRGLLQHYGANRTGRWAGRLVQVQNLPQNHLKALALARQLAKERKTLNLDMLYGNIPDTLSQLIRTAFIPRPGCVYHVADFSAIEARVIAWMAGERWRLEVFATHGKIYEASASAMFGIPLAEITKALRQQGKVAELALGYQGGEAALEKMDKGHAIPQEQYGEIVKKWRASNARIVDFWHGLEAAALSVVRNGVPVGIYRLLFARESDSSTGQDFLTVRLPSGRKLYYVRPRLTLNQWGRDSIQYEGMDQKTKKWGVSDLYGGKLAENVTQAIARDCLAISIQRLDATGRLPVMHVHDEVITEGPDDPNELKKICAIMGQSIPWAPGLLLKAEGFTTPFYKKDE